VYPLPGDRRACGGQQAVEGCRTGGQHAGAHSRDQLQVPVALESRHENGQERLQPLAADTVRSFPENDERLAHHFIDTETGQITDP
jgi:hypothetical protein